MTIDFYDTAALPPVDPGREPQRTFANPFLACDACGNQVAWRLEIRNVPCGHRADFTSACPSWTPSAGCVCLDVGEVHGWPPTLVRSRSPEFRSPYPVG